VYAPGAAFNLPVVPFDAPFTVGLEMFTEPGCAGTADAVGQSNPTSISSKQQTSQKVYVPVSPIGLFVPTTSAVSAQATNPASPRLGASATLLPDGRVVVIGGARLKNAGVGLFDNPQEDRRPWDVLDNIEEIYDTVEVYDSATGVWQSYDTNEASPQTLFYRRAFHQAVHLPGLNLIAIVGGYQQAQVGSPIEPSVYVEFFDPTTGVFLAPDYAGGMTLPRVGHSASALTYFANGAPREYILVVGGRGSQAASSYEVLGITKDDPTTSARENVLVFAPLPNSRHDHKAVMVENSAGDRQIFFVGGEDANDNLTGAVDIYQVDTEDNNPGFLEVPGFQAPTGIEVPRIGHDVVYVAPGTPGLNAGVYVFGGFIDSERTKLATRIEVLDRSSGVGLAPAANNFNLNTGRAYHAAAVLPSGQILVTGGVQYDGGKLRPVSSNEYIDRVRNAASGEWEIRALTASSMISQRFHHLAVGLPNGQGLVLGGLLKLEDDVRMVGGQATDQGSEWVSFRLSE
jgi:hypothetical protein